MGHLVAQSAAALHLMVLSAMSLSAIADVPTEAPAPTSRKLLSSINEAAGCSCDACKGVVSRPHADGVDIVSLLTCRGAPVPGSCGDDFCEKSCKVHIPSEPKKNPRCREKGPAAPEGLSLAQLREVTRLRTKCPQPQACSCRCICPEIVWPPMLGPPFMVPTPQPFFGGSFVQVSADEELEKNQSTATSLLETGAQSQGRRATSVAAAAHAALQKAQNSIVKETYNFPHVEILSEEARLRQHRRWLNGGGDSNNKGLDMASTVLAEMAEVDYKYTAHPKGAHSMDVAPRTEFATSAIQTAQGQASAATSTRKLFQTRNLLKQQPYLMLPPPPGPPPAPLPFRKDFRGGETCPENAPCNCYCHCKAPTGVQLNWKPNHPQPFFNP